MGLAAAMQIGEQVSYFGCGLCDARRVTGDTAGEFELRVRHHEAKPERSPNFRWGDLICPGRALVGRLEASTDCRLWYWPAVSQGYRTPNSRWSSWLGFAMRFACFDCFPGSNVLA